MGGRRIATGRVVCVVVVVCAVDAKWQREVEGGLARQREHRRGEEGEEGGMLQARGCVSVSRKPNNNNNRSSRGLS